MELSKAPSSSFWKCSFLILCIYFISHISCAIQEEKPDLDKLLADANGYFTKGDMETAQNLFRKFLKWDPENTAALFKQGHCLFALNRISPAKATFTKLIELNPSFHKPYILRAKLHLKEGNFEDVQADINKAWKLSSSDPLIEEVKHALGQSRQLHEQLETLFQNKQYKEALEVVDQLLMHMTHTIPVRLKRVECFLQTQQYPLAVGEYTRLFQLTSNLDYMGKASDLLYYAMYQPEKAFSTVKECLRSDPDHAECRKLFKAIKQNQPLIETSTGRADLKEVQKLREGLPARAVGLRAHLASLLCKASRSVELCEEAVDMYPERSDFLKRYIELLTKSSELVDLEKAERLVEEANTKFSSERHIWRGLHQKIQVRLKQAKATDYYKVLGVDRNASPSEIKRAYLKLAKQYHPDKYRGDLSPEQVEEKMREFNLAYGVLKDPQKKEQYDTTGEDPNNPNAGQNPFGHGGGDPFMQFFQKSGPFGGGNGGGGNEQFFFFQGF